ncbi:alpha-keto acid decarboxylase family protein [Bythopirellula polymerisocia]|uniref:Indole-3-pyruvate decarboxylase n=1 Tax=Bythopirellula polymerisocia TaxID=2528003 RepID=A0A5C6D2G1_9BACT|nr:thiamine pyrophosphate-dependent enzyme [Bythopirellula polymerisocia]TWU29971.1 Indole-3-pyruvate decarboxylase [Bythopirellula polymerisocia]
MSKTNLTSSENPSIGEYLIRRLQDYGVADVFGIPGDYILSFYTMLEEGPLNTIGCTREDCAGFAADAYARVHGMGALCVTYCVGGLSVCNSIAGAYAEKSPVVMITGSPGMRERIHNPLLHHMVRNFRTQYDVFEKLCVAGTELNDPLTAFREIDRVLAACDRFKRPVYIEIPRDMVHVRPEAQLSLEVKPPQSDSRALAEAVEEAARRIETARQPVFLLGVEIHRFGLQAEVLQLAEASGIPMTATMLGKGVVAETHPLYMGLYEGALGREEVTKYVESSDCVVMLGTFMTDINLGIYTAELSISDCIYATSEQLRIRHHHYHDVRLQDFLHELAERGLQVKQPLPPAPTDWNKDPFVLSAEAPVTITRLIDRLDEQLDDKTIVVADIGDALFASTELTTHGHTEFLSPAYYTSMGFAVPASLGAQVARPEARVIAIVGDGAFQMTGMEFSSLVSRHMPVIVIVLNNGGYGTERLLHPGQYEFNNIPSWQYDQLPALLGGGTGYQVHTEADFDQALNAAWKDKSGPSIFNVHLDPNDCSQALTRLAERMSQTVVQK